MLPSEYSIRSKIEKMFVSEKIFEEYYVKIYKVDPYFHNEYKEKIKAGKNGCEYIAFRIDIYFSEDNFAVEVAEKEHTDRDLIFEKKRQEALGKKNLIVNLLEVILIKKIMMYFVKVVEQKHLLVILRIKNLKIRRRNEKIKVKNNYKRWCKKRRTIPAQYK